MTYTITKKGTVSIPSAMRVKYGLREGTKVEFFDTEEGIVIVPVVSDSGSVRRGQVARDKSPEKLVREMVREIHQERRPRLIEKREGVPSSMFGMDKGRKLKFTRREHEEISRD